MTRYTINIGDDFPLGEEPSPRDETPDGSWRRHRRYGLVLRVLFFLAVAAIVITHPITTLIVVGLVLWLRRTGFFYDLRTRLGAAWRDCPWRREGWNGFQNGGGCWSRHRTHRRYGSGPPREDAREGGYRGFV